MKYISLLDTANGKRNSTSLAIFSMLEHLYFPTLTNKWSENEENLFKFML